MVFKLIVFPILNFIFYVLIMLQSAFLNSNISTSISLNTQTHIWLLGRFDSLDGLDLVVLVFWLEEGDFDIFNPNWK